MIFASEKFARVRISTDVQAIRPEDRPVLSLIIQASHLLNPIYLRQVSSLNPQYKQEIEDTGNRRLIESFRIMAGPWDRLDGDKPFYGSIEKPLGAGFYPADMTREEFLEWCASHPEQSAALTSFTTIVRRHHGDLVAIPYSHAYELELQKAADLLRQAAGLAQNASLARFLSSRADALLSNDYLCSDGDWIALDSDIECIYGPYETYEDRLFGYKAAFGACIGYRVARETARVAHYSKIADAMHEALPISAEMKATRVPQPDSPFVVIDVLSTSGDARSGIQTLACVLPNDPAVIDKYGTKKVMLRNLQHAKFDEILRPIASHFLDQGTLDDVSFEAFFRHTILHETGHSLGPKGTASGNETIIHALADTYAPIEECKADSTATYLSFWLSERGELSPQDIRETCATLLAGIFRSLRFGLEQAHARANAIQLSFYLERGAIVQSATHEFSCDLDVLRQANRDLVAQICDIEYSGDRERANAFLSRYAVLPDSIQNRLARLEGEIPVDIVCHYDAEAPGFFDTQS